MVKNSLRKRRNRPLFFVDIAVPRDVEPEVNGLSNVYVYDVDDLKGVVDLNKEQRQQEAVRAERIVQEEVVKFEKWLDTLSVVPTIVSLREKAENIIQAELKKSASALTGLTPAQISAVEILTRSVAEKVISDPIVFLKKKADRPVVNAYLDVTRKLFGLDDNGGDKNS
jgi:glutamyl-tRNA reductase